MPAVVRKKKETHAARRAAANGEKGIRLLKPSTLLGLAFMLGAVVAGPYLPSLLPNLAQQPEYQFALSELRVTPPNPWVPQDLITKLVDRGELPKQVSLLDPGVARQVGDVLSRHPWIRKVEMIRATGDPVLQAFLEYRRPVAIIEQGTTGYYVDADGVVLPPGDFAPADMGRLPVVRNIHSQPPLSAGRKWDDVAVLESAKLADCLCPDNDMGRYWKRFEFAAIVAPAVSNTETDPRLLTFRIALAGGSEVVWGHAPGADTLEPTVEQKLGKLEQMHQRGDFTRLQTPHEIDISLFGNQFSSVPLEGALRR